MKSMKKIKNKKRGRPRKSRPKKIIWKLPEGVKHVALASKHPQSKTHRWLAFAQDRVIGYYKSCAAAAKAVETLKN